MVNCKSVIQGENRLAARKKISEIVGDMASGEDYKIQGVDL